MPALPFTEPGQCSSAEHLSRRRFLKGTLATASGGVLLNWGGLTSLPALAEEVRREQKHCILLWMNGGVSQFETFDMKPGRPTGGLFRPVGTNVPGTHICELMPKMSRADGQDRRDPVDEDVRGRSSRRHLPDAHRLSAQFDGPVPGDRLDRGEVPGPRRPRPAELHQGLVAGERRGRVPRAAVSAVLDRVGRPVAPLLGLRHGSRRRTAAARAAGPCTEESFAATEPHGGRAGASRGVRSRAAAAERPGRVPARRRMVEVLVPSMATALSGGGACWRGGWWRPASPSWKIGQSSYDSHADNFGWHKGLLPPMEHAWAGLLVDLQERGLAGERRSSYGPVKSAARPISTTAPGAITTSAAGPRPSPAAASKAASSTARPTRTGSR